MVTKIIKGECEFCGEMDVDLYPQRNDMMCQDCINRENAVTASVKVVETARAQDDKVVLKNDIMNAATTSFIELHSAILNNPDIKPADHKARLIQEAAIRIQKLDAVIFAREAETMDLRNERMAWLKNSRELVSTMNADEQKKYAHLNMNYKPTTAPTPKQIRETKKKVTSSRPISPASKYTHKELVEACEKYGADMSMVRMKMLSPSGRDMSPAQAAQFVAAKSTASN